MFIAGILGWALDVAFRETPNAHERMKATESRSTDDWIASEGIRAGWIRQTDGVGSIWKFREVGMNALALDFGPTASDKAGFKEWAKESKRAGIHLFGILRFNANASEMKMRRAVFSNGWESYAPCPTNWEFWERQICQDALELATQSMAADLDISGILIDFELYINEKHGQPVYYTDGCYCDHCFGRFLQNKDLKVATASLSYPERAIWLERRGRIGDYKIFLQEEVQRLAIKIRKTVKEKAQRFLLGFYPSPRNWMLRGVAQGFGTRKHPMLLWATDTYSGKGANQMPEKRWEELKKDQIYCYYAAGFLLRWYTASNISAHILLASLRSDGYWLFTLHSLTTEWDKLSPGFRLAKGTANDYLKEIAKANRELDRVKADPSYRPDVNLVGNGR